ncbi:bifunctional DNA primase/polymerase [Microbacterium sp. SSW1-59]|uniref:bifunctional DNA primase/polymerase n=1 Tax=Microbacterium xanthum TaxID=3079794 RepID=UPI002AD268E0|nr:bifunctional DNA primase/polymerase [Microbacterium sp. SSW1-59]MDZ8202086.1 bifunctional DNA primase/polymerase [Microbacterium sp. SSW1-59]
MSAVDVALSLAALGWHVFPCAANGKPLVRWGEEATTDRAAIRKWFRRDERVGIHCGRSGLLVVDRDRKDGRDGFASLKAEGRPLPRTFHYTSRSGKGRHDFYAAPADVDCTIATDVHGMKGVDIRAGQGIVIYNGPALTEAPQLAPAPAWGVVQRQEHGYSSTVSLDAWLAEERSPEPSAKARRLAAAMPLEGVSNPDLLALLTPLVDALMMGYGRRLTYDIARERYTRNYPDAGEAFDKAWTRAIARVEADWDAVMQAPPTEYVSRARDEHDSDDLYVDVAAVLRGARRRAKATIGTRTDGQGLFYRGKVNTLMGDPESGKTLIAACIAADVLAAGGRVLWLDLDHNGGPDMVALLQGFGVHTSVLMDRARFRLASEVLDGQEDVLRAVADAAEWGPDYVVIDSVGELLPLFGASSDSADDFTSVNRKVAARLATQGACVVTIDHLAKGHDSRAYGASGTMAKKRAANGAYYEVVNVITFTPSGGGRADLRIVKDRPGNVRDNSPRDGKRPRAASFGLNRDAQDQPQWRFFAPQDAPVKPPTRSLEVQMVESDVDKLRALDPAPTSKRDVMARMKWGGPRALEALRQYREAMANA